MKKSAVLSTLLSATASALLLAPGCGGKVATSPSDSGDSGGPGGDVGTPPPAVTCESACATCSSFICVSQCQAAEAQCAAAGQSAAFDAYRDCVAKAENCGMNCGAAPVCNAVLDAGQTDSQPPFDSGPLPPPFDAGPPPMDSGMDSNGAPACYANASFTPPPWQPPTPFSTTQCTPAQVTAWIASLNAGTFPPTSGSATCDTCILTPVSNPAYGPAVYDPANLSTAFLNQGGCIAHFDGMTAAGSCGDQYNRANNCAAAECAPESATQPGCPDWNNDGPMTQQCVAYAFGPSGSCNAYLLSSSCVAEINADAGGESICILGANDLAAFLNLWCG